MRIVAIITLLVLNLSSIALWGQSDTTKVDKKTLTALENLVNNLSQAQTSIQTEMGEGSILDQTKTRAGKDFYDFLVQGLEIPANFTNYSILVDEKPGLGTSTIISVLINDYEIYSNYLQPKRDIIEETAQEAIDYATEFIANYNQIILELTSEEQKGSGIF